MLQKASEPQKRIYDSIWMYSVLFLYAVILFITIFRHEPWSDEAQAWLLARDAGLKDLFVHYLRYEGSPGLWHLILMVPAKLHLPYFSMQILSGIIAVFGVFVFLRYAPFPKLLKTLFPFTYFVIYQYAAVARSYVLFPTVIFLLALIYPDRFKRPWMHFCLIVLLASISLQGTAIAVGLLLAHYFDVGCAWRSLSSKYRKGQIIIACILFAWLLSMLYVLWLPKDLFFIARLSKFNQIERIINILIIFGDVLLTNLIKGDNYTVLSLIMLGMSLLIWHFTFKLTKEKNMVLHMILPLLLVSMLFVNISNPWNIGVLFFFWIFLGWINEPFKQGETWNWKNPKGYPAITVFILIFAVQLVWSYKTISFDWHYSYSGSRAVAEYIKKNHLENKRIFFKQSYFSAVGAYFDRNILANPANPKRSFMVWSKKENNYNLRFPRILKEQPDLIIIRVMNIWGNYRVKPILNYKFAGIFNGSIYWKDRTFHNETYFVFRKERELPVGERISARDMIDSLHSFSINEYPEYLIKNRGPVIGSY